MEQRDYLLREIEKIGQMIMGMIGKLQPKKSTTEYHAGLKLANQEFEYETGLSLEIFAGMDRKSLDAFLENHPELDANNQELLADLLTDIGEESEGYSEDKPRMYFSQALVLLQRLDQDKKTFSFERAGKIEYLKGLLV